MLLLPVLNQLFEYNSWASRGSQATADGCAHLQGASGKLA